MPRRAARKPPASLDLSGHYFELALVPCPLDVGGWFGRAAPLEVEIGTGKGLFLATAAATQPAHNFLGLEIAEAYARHAAGRLAQTALANARLVHGDAQQFLAEWLPAASALAVHVYFPDPWWKKRHRKRRVLNPAVLNQVARILVDDGRLHFWTDVEEYYQTTLALVAEVRQLTGPEHVPEPQATHDLDYRTHFERRTRLAGERVYRSAFRRLPR